MSRGARYEEHQTTYHIKQKSTKRYLGDSKAAGHPVIHDSWNPTIYPWIDLKARRPIQVILVTHIRWLYRQVTKDFTLMYHENLFYNIDGVKQCVRDKITL